MTNERVLVIKDKGIQNITKGINEVKKFSWELTDIKGIRSNYDKMESWSQLVLDEIQRSTKEN